MHNYNIKKSGTITGNAAILKPQIQTHIWVASWTQPTKTTNTYEFQEICFPRTISLCSYFFPGPQESLIVCCLHLEKEYQGVSGVASYITTDEQLQYTEDAFFVQTMLPEGFPFHQFNSIKYTG